jgi:indolepyruvate ferredoxin oxidoreductase alpha subunit
MDLDRYIRPTAVSRSSILLGNPGETMLMSCNEAVARGAIEAGVRVATSYPGSPLTTVIDYLANAVEKYPNMHVEWSTNEKVAFEVALGASIAGLRALTVMKNVGFNWTADPLGHAALHGAPGLVISSNDDPPGENTGTTADIRYLAMYTDTVVVEPSSIQEVKDMTAAAFELSEQAHLPVLVRVTERTGYARGPVMLGPIQHRAREREPRFDKSTNGWSQSYYLPPFKDYPTWFNRHVGTNMRFHDEGSKELLEHVGPVPSEANTLKLIEAFPFHKIEIAPQAKIGVITAGASYNATMEAMGELGKPKEIAVLKLGATYPLPLALVKKMLTETETVLVVEEILPFVEHQVRSIAAGMEKRAKIVGKLTRHIPYANEIERNVVAEALGKLLGKKFRPRPSAHRSATGRQIRQDEKDTLADQVRFCPGCPEQAAISALKIVCREMGIETIALADNGCHEASHFPPLEFENIWASMGNSIGEGQGLYHSGLKEKIVVITGDSAFFHADLPELVNSVYNKANILVYVMDNRTTAMTGHQPHPGAFGVTATGEATKMLDIAEIARALQVDFVEVVDPYDFAQTCEVLQRAIRTQGVSMVVARRTCAVLAERQKRG